MRAPDVTGAGKWRAWRCPRPETGVPDHQAHIGGWLLHCPGAHAFWSYWWIALIHLRPIPGVKAAHIKTPGAGWEMICFAQDPGTEPDPDRAVETFKPLSPIDWVVQFGDVKDDHEATRVAGAVVDAIMRGDVSPDSDFRSFWERTIPATAKHFAEGAHPEH